MQSCLKNNKLFNQIDKNDFAKCESVIITFIAFYRIWHRLCTVWPVAAAPSQGEKWSH